MELALPAEIKQTTKDEVIRLYQAGVKTDEIAEQTGVQRASQYYILRTAGVSTNRTRRNDGADITVGQLMEQLSIKDRRIGQLEALALQMYSDLPDEPRSIKDRAAEQMTRLGIPHS